MSDDIDSKEILEQKFPIITIEDEMRDSYLGVRDECYCWKSSS